MEQEQKPKEVWEAEVKKLEAEAEAARSEAERDRAEAARLTAETRARVAEAREAEAEARKAEMALEDAEYKRRIELQKDEYHHIYQFNGSVGGSSVQECMKQLRTWARLDKDKPKEAKTPIEIWFNSPGGSVIDGMALFDVVTSLRTAGHHIQTGTVGYAASMAGILLQAGDKRVMGREAYVLIHEIAAGAMGKIGEIEDTVEFLKKIEDRVLSIFAERSKEANEKHPELCTKPLSKKQIANRWKRKDWWITSAECLEYGFVDELR